MHEIVPQSQLADRLAKLGLSPTEFSRRTSLHYQTVLRATRGRNIGTHTLEEISRHIIALEREALDHLKRLHDTGAAA